MKRASRVRRKFREGIRSGLVERNGILREARASTNSTEKGQLNGLDDRSQHHLSVEGNGEITFAAVSERRFSFLFYPSWAGHAVRRTGVASARYVTCIPTIGLPLRKARTWRVDAKGRRAHDGFLKFIILVVFICFVVELQFF